MPVLVDAEGVELAKTVTELRCDRQRLDDERRATVDELTATQQRLDQLNDAQLRVVSLQSQLADRSSQARPTPFTIRYDTMHYIFTCVEKLIINSQLTLSHGTKQNEN